jgi:uncharacterized protein YbjT (DUF2867 family)
MLVFVTGATGFIGMELVKELIEVGHQVRGLTRSDAGVEQLKAVGAEVHRGDITDLDSLRSGATAMDAVVNLAFNHDDMSKFGIRLSNAPVVRLHLVLNLVDERSGISTEAAESGRGGEAGCGA